MKRIPVVTWPGLGFAMAALVLMASVEPTPAAVLVFAGLFFSAAILLAYAFIRWAEGESSWLS